MGDRLHRNNGTMFGFGFEFVFELTFVFGVILLVVGGE